MVSTSGRDFEQKVRILSALNLCFSIQIVPSYTLHSKQQPGLTIQARHDCEKIAITGLEAFRKKEKIDVLSLITKMSGMG